MNSVIVALSSVCVMFSLVAMTIAATIQPLPTLKEKPSIVAIYEDGQLLFKHKDY